MQRSANANDLESSEIRNADVAVADQRQRILLVDDDSEVRCFLRQELEFEQYFCDEASSGMQALRLLRSLPWDLVILDWGLPDLNGVEVCRRLRETEDQTPVLMLTAHDAIHERVEALDAGADDYLTKPFSLEEMLARVRARLRVHSQQRSVEMNSNRCGNIALHVLSHEVTCLDVVINLTNREFDLLHCLLRRCGQVVERRVLMLEVWGDGWVGDGNVLDVYIRNLRRKLDSVDSLCLIRTVRGIGFILQEAD